jgi:conjugal transfer/entry exclusion protein
METPKDQLIELYYQRVQAMTEKINQLQNQLNYYEIHSRKRRMV